MHKIQRGQTKNIIRDLKQKMVFIVGPRQVGKTWLAREVAEGYSDALYLNYDDARHRMIIRDESWLPETPLVIFDEIHKMKGWKNYLKGVYDTKSTGMRILVTGSARLDAHRRMGDSLAGRFFTHHLMPLTLAELAPTKYAQDVERLFVRGGFPEPFLADSENDAARWRNMYSELLLREDVLDFANVDNLLAMRHVFDLLRHRVGSPVSSSAIARDIGISPITVRRYIGIFEALYMIFIVRPYTHKIARSILKEPKIYFYDHALVENGDGARFENLVAVALYARLLEKGDARGAYGRLAFLKTKEGKETDFALVSHKNVLEQIVETKIADDKASPALRYFSEKYTIPGTQVVKQLHTERSLSPFLEIRRAQTYLSKLP